MKDVIAILPIEIKGKGICSQIYYVDEVVNDQRTCTNFLKNMCDQRNISHKLMRKSIKEICNIKRNIPRGIDSLNIFFGFKFRESSIDDQRRGYVNCRFVKDISSNNIILTTDETITTLLSEESLKTNRKNAKYLMYMALCRESYLKEERNKIAKSLSSIDFLFK